MPTVEVLTPPVPAAEPVTLAQAAAWCREDWDSALIATYVAGEGMPEGADPGIWAQIELLALTRTAAREKVEAHTGRYFAPQELKITYELGEGYALPAGATATAVDGFFTDLDALAGAATWLEEYRKGISVNRELPWPQAMRQTFTVTATTTGDTSFQALAKRAILEITGEWWRNREVTVSGVATISELPVSWRVALAQAVVHPIGY